MESPTTLDEFIDELTNIRHHSWLGKCPFGFYYVRRRTPLPNRVMECDLVEFRPLVIAKLYTVLDQPFTGVVLDRGDGQSKNHTRIHWPLNNHRRIRALERDEMVS
jgi:hypothetical protein